MVCLNGCDCPAKCCRIDSFYPEYSKGEKFMMLKHSKKHLLWRLCTIFFFISFVAIGCSSSSSDNGNGNHDSLYGTYYLSLFADSTDVNYNQMNKVNFDGAGNLEAGAVYDSASPYDSGGDTIDYTGAYDIAADGTFTFTGTDIKGILSSDGNMMITVDPDPTDSDNEISIGAAIKAATNAGNSLLNGKYTLCQIRYDGEAMKASRITITFDGAGSLTGTVADDSDDGPGTEDALTGTYSVAANGRLDMSITGLPKTFDGSVAPDGDSLVIIDDDNDGEVLLMVGVKASTGKTVSSLNGTYQVHVFGGDDSGAWASLVDATFDGNGTLSAVPIAASDNDLTAPPDRSYSVEGDGALTIGMTNEKGMISPSGDIFVVGDASNTDSEVSIVIGVKKS
jgi:hypothetical protein